MAKGKNPRKEKKKPKNKKDKKSKSKNNNEGKRDFLIISTYTMAGIGAATVAWPLIDQMNPAADTLALGMVTILLVRSINVVWRQVIFCT